LLSVRRLLLKSSLELRRRWIFPRRLVLHPPRGEALGWSAHEVEHALTPLPAKQGLAQ